MSSAERFVSVTRLKTNRRRGAVGAWPLFLCLACLPPEPVASCFVLYDAAPASREERPPRPGWHKAYRSSDGSFDADATIASRGRHSLVLYGRNGWLSCRSRSSFRDNGTLFALWPQPPEELEKPARPQRILAARPVAGAW